MKILIQVLAAALSTATVFAAQALDGDRDQPATLDADHFEIDLKAGVQVYRGDVVFTQGSVRLDCDRLTTYRDENDRLDKAVCDGRPGRFRQRPEGHDQDITGSAMEITMDHAAGRVTLRDAARVVQGGRTMTGGVIIYDLDSGKVRVDAGDGGARPRVVIQPASQAVKSATE